MFLLGYDIGSSSVKASLVMRRLVNVYPRHFFRKQKRILLQ